MSGRTKTLCTMMITRGKNSGRRCCDVYPHGCRNSTHREKMQELADAAARQPVQSQIYGHIPTLDEMEEMSLRLASVPPRIVSEESIAAPSLTPAAPPIAPAAPPIAAPIASAAPPIASAPIVPAPIAPAAPIVPTPTPTPAPAPAPAPTPASNPDEAYLALPHGTRTCPSCYKSFSRPYNLKIHMRKCSMIDPLI